MSKAAKARILINGLLQRSGWRLFDDENGLANVAFEVNVKLKKKDFDALGEDFEKTASGFVDYLLLDEYGFPIAILEAKPEKFDPLVGKEQARKYARSQNVRFMILSNGNLHYFWDLEQGNPVLITEYPHPESFGHFQTFKPNPDTLAGEKIAADYVAVNTTTVLPSQTRKLKEVVKGYTNFRQNDVLLAKITPCFENGKIAIAGPLVNDIGFGFTEFIVIRCNPKKILPPLLLLYVSDTTFRHLGRLNMTGSAGQQRIPADFVRQYEIPLPPLNIQREIVAELEAERKLVEANRGLIKRMEKKIKNKLAEIWGEEQTI